MEAVGATAARIGSPMTRVISEGMAINVEQLVEVGGHVHV